MQPLTVSRVLGDGPFAKIGEPQALEVDEERGLIAVGGHVGWLRRIGAAVGATAWKPHAIGIHDRADLRCRFLVRSRHPVRSMAFHPRSPLLAIGTGSYDGGMFFRGELLLNLDTGAVVSALESGPEVRVVTWRDGQVLDLAVSPYGDEELKHESYTVGFDAMVTREDWDRRAGRGDRPPGTGRADAGERRVGERGGGAGARRGPLPGVVAAP